MGRSMHWTLEDNMRDGLFFCPTLTSLRESPYPICASRNRNVRHQCRGSWAGPTMFLAEPFQEVGSGTKVRSLVVLSNLSAFHLTSVIVVRWTDKLLSSGYKRVSDLRCRAFPFDGQESAEWSRCPGTMGRRARDSVASLRRSSAGWMPVRMGRLFASVGRGHPVAICKASLMAWSVKRVWSLRNQTGAQYSAVEYTRARVAVRNVAAPTP